MIFRFAHAPIGYAFADPTLLLAGRKPLIFGEQRIDFIPHRRIDDARRDAVDIDPVLDEAEARRLGKADDGGLGGAIDGDQSFAAPASLRCHIDDLAALAALYHALRHSL